jgi:segregation and condensation protein B
MDENKETVLAEDNPELEAVITETPTEANELVENVSDGSEMPVGRALNKGRRLKPDEDEPEGEEPHEKMSQEKAMRVLEAIMFANGDEVYYDQFAKIIGYTPKEAMKVVDAYAALYDTEAFPRGIKLVKYEKCCQLTTCPELGEYVTQMIGIRGEPQLSPAAMETLAIVAYNQPVTRAYIEQVRRVDSTRPITVLLDRELIEEKGRLEVIGRPRLFGTTQNFLRTFGITSLSELPSLDLFSVDM